MMRGSFLVGLILLFLPACKPIIVWTAPVWMPPNEVSSSIRYDRQLQYARDLVDSGERYWEEVKTAPSAYGHSRDAEYWLLDLRGFVMSRFALSEVKRKKKLAEINQLLQEAIILRDKIRSEAPDEMRDEIEKEDALYEKRMQEVRKEFGKYLKRWDNRRF